MSMKNKIRDLLSGIHRIIFFLPLLPPLPTKIPWVDIKDMYGDTLLNNRNPPLHEISYLAKGFFLGEDKTLGLLMIYHFQILMYINKVSELFMSTCFQVPLSLYFLGCMYNIRTLHFAPMPHQILSVFGRFL